MNKMLFVTAAAALLVSFSQRAIADGPYTLFNPVPSDKLHDLETDRPDKTNTPVTADAGHVIIETGIFDDTYNQDHYHGDDAISNNLALGQFNFRVGVLDNLELNVVVNSWDYSAFKDYNAGESEYQNGFGDLVVGGKLNLWGNNITDAPWQTAFGIQPELKIPTARKDIGNAHAEATVGFPLLVNLPDGFHLGLQTTVGWNRNSAGDADVTGWQNSITIDKVLSEKCPFDVYIEYWNYVTSERHQEAQQTLDVGFVYPLNDDLQLDTGVNLGLDRASDSVEVTAGITIRI